MARKRSSVKVICSCGNVVSGNGKCKCGRSYQVGVKDAPKKSSRKKQDALFVPVKTQAFVMQFMAAMFILVLAITILATSGGG